MALPLEHGWACGGRVTAGEEGADVRPMAAAVAGALISGVGMYAIGTHAQNRAANPFAPNAPAGYYAVAPQPYGAPQQPQALVPQGTTGYYVTTPQPTAAPVVNYSAPPVASYPVAGYASAQPVGSYYVTAPQAFASPVVERQVVAPRQTVYREVAPARPVETRSHRSVAKTALVIGGSAAGGAGVGGLIGGKKGALLGAALGGGAASIYEATRR